MRKITPPQKRILEKLIFPEPYEKVLEETGMHQGELRDELINLISFGYIVAYETDTGLEQKLEFYDTDNLQLFTFQATKQGLAEI